MRFEGRVDRRRPLRVYPAPERLRRLVTPARTQAATGSQVSPVRAEGLEFADTPYGSVEKISLRLHGMYWKGRELFVQTLSR